VSKTTIQSILDASPKRFKYGAMDKSGVCFLSVTQLKKSYITWDNSEKSGYQSISDLVEKKPKNWETSLVKRTEKKFVKCSHTKKTANNFENTNFTIEDNEDCTLEGGDDTALLTRNKPWDIKNISTYNCVSSIIKDWCNDNKENYQHNALFISLADTLTSFIERSYLNEELNSEYDEEEFNIKEGDKCFVRSEDSEPWGFTLFSNHYKESYHYYCFLTSACRLFKQIVSYEGNEGLAGTTKEPNTKVWTAEDFK
jgi:hypothetical protein